MSGARNIEALRATSCTITLMKALRHFIGTEACAQGSCDACSKVENILPVVLEVLGAIKEIQRCRVANFQAHWTLAERESSERSAFADTTIMMRCEKHARNLQSMIWDCKLGDEAMRALRYWTDTQIIGLEKDQRVRFLTMEILENLKLLHVKNLPKDDLRLHKLDSALSGIAQLPSSSLSRPSQASVAQHRLNFDGVGNRLESRVLGAGEAT